MTYPPVNPELPIVAIDFDGVLAECTWPSPELGRSIKEGIDLLLHYHEQEAEIVILTSRPESHWPRMWRWLDEKGLTGIIYDITNQKVRASVYVDDRAVRFPIQRVLPNDEIEVDYRPPDLFDDTEPESSCKCKAEPYDWKAEDWAHNERYFAARDSKPYFISKDALWAEFTDEDGYPAISPWLKRKAHPSSQRFHKILKELGDLHDAKAKGYGTDEDPLANVRASAEWGMPAWVGAMLRGQDKIKRLQAFAKKGELPFEAVEDAFRDLAVYSILGLVLFEQEEAAKV